MDVEAHIVVVDNDEETRNEPCLSALRTHTLGVDCVRKMAGQSILHIVCVCINRIGTQ